VGAADGGEDQGIGQGGHDLGGPVRHVDGHRRPLSRTA
jgi:hypothetical protein